eukprot:scaffold3719_cov247-Pinguiococcus_pyrenoidosus.AAC.1
MQVHLAQQTIKAAKRDFLLLPLTTSRRNLDGEGLIGVRKQIDGQPSKLALELLVSIGVCAGGDAQARGLVEVANQQGDVLKQDSLIACRPRRRNGMRLKIFVPLQDLKVPRLKSLRREIQHHVKGDNISLMQPVVSHVIQPKAQSLFTQDRASVPSTKA